MKKMLKKTPVFGIIAILIITFIIPTNATKLAVEKQFANHREGIILYVGGNGPDNYTTIQSAVDNSSDGDTVFVYSVSSPYIENIVVDKSISILGEDKNSTIIDGSNQRESALLINSVDVRVSGFKFKNGWYGGIESKSSDSQIIGNVFEKCSPGLLIYNTHGNKIGDNRFYHNYFSIRLEGADNCIIYDNYFDKHRCPGITLRESSNNNIFNNEIYQNPYDISNRIDLDDCNGIALEDSSNNIISNNRIISKINNRFSGIDFWNSNNNIVDNNTFIKNGIVRFNSYNIVHDSNTVNGKPLVYLKSISDKVIDDAGQVILVNCDNITVKNLDLSYLFKGVELDKTSNCQIINNKFSNCVLGVDLQRLSNNNYISYNEMNFGRYGITIESGISNLITNNIMMNNDNDGIEVLSSFNTISNNIITQNGGGISIGYGLRNTVISNEISNNEMGIYLQNTLLNKIQRNNIYNNEEFEVYFINSFVNLWIRNYWNDLIPPYRINGLIYIERGAGWDAPPPIEIPIYNYDWLPALRAYKIEI